MKSCILVSSYRSSLNSSESDDLENYVVIVSKGGNHIQLGLLTYRLVIILFIL